jgi:3-keto-5-aminohexanoate cleavage enzyme
MSVSSPVWLEVALNGAWTRAIQPRAPFSVAQIIEEGVACASEGAAIVHVHAYDERGQPIEDADIYTRIIEGIRARCDAIVYPTIAFTPEDPDSPQRLAPLRELSRRGLLEWLPVDPGSININRYEAVAKGQNGRFYLNPESHLRRGLELAAEHDEVPTYAIYEPGFIRLGAALAASTKGLKTPVYRLMFTEQRIWGFPAEPFALESYLALLEREAKGAPWMIAGHEVDVRPLIMPAVEAGGHVRVGLEDAPFGSEMMNVDWVRSAAELVHASGRRLATASEIRAATK